MKSLLYLKRYLVQYRIRLIIGMICIFAGNWFALLIPEYTGRAVDHIKSGNPTMAGLRWYAFYIILMALLQAIFFYGMRKNIYTAARDIEFDFRNELFRKFQSLHSGYYDEQKTGDLMARATNDMEAVRMLLGPGLLFLAFSCFIFPVAVFRMLNINIALTCYSVIPLIIMPFYVNRIGNKIHRKFTLVQEQYSVLTSMVQENLAGIRVVKAFVQERPQLDQFQELNREFKDRNMALARIRAGFFPGMRILGGSGILILIWLGGRRVIQNQVSLGDLTALIMIHLRLFWPMIAFGWIISLHQRGAASMKRLLSILEHPPTIRDDEKTDHSIARISGDIRMENLSFRYPGEEEPDLQNISLRIPDGSTLGIVGPIGSGKSTLIRLLVRLYNPPPGKIFIDGRDILEIPLKTLRDHTGYVFQEPFIFSESIAENVTMGPVNGNMEEVKKICRRVRLHEEIESFPHGYETMLGERGVNLSGGQKQRLALARALFRDPDILILDDTLSAVDTETESYILSVLRRETKHRTSIIISHRISSVMAADEIIFLNRGVIQERGTHEQLVQAGGHYAAIFEKQKLEQEFDRNDDNQNS